MPAFIIMVAGWFGISPVRIIVYAGIVVVVIVGAVTIRQHYVNLGYAKAIEAVKKQDGKAVEAAKQVEKKAAECSEANGYWDVITQGCKLEDAE